MGNGRLLLAAGTLLVVAGCSGARRDAEAQALFEDGSARIAEGDYSGGVARMRRVLEEHPDSPAGRRVADDWAYYEELLAIEMERLPSLAATELLRIGAAVERHRDRRGQYPPTLTTLVPGYLDRVPRDPWGRDYEYRRDRRGYTLATRGRDGKPGGAGEDRDIQVVNGTLRNARLARR